MTPEEVQNIKDLLLLTSPLIKSLVDTFVTPKLESFRKRFDLDNSKYDIPSEQHFQEYFHRMYKNLLVINTLVFNNSQRLLKDVYQPLTLCSLQNKEFTEKALGFPTKVSDEFGNVLITDCAGMGKSTLMKKIFIDIIEKNIGIPLFIELRRLNREKTVIQEIHEQLNSLNKVFDSELLLELLVEGDFIIIFDGYDEISLSEREFVTSDIQSFISKASNNRFFLTSRPEKSLSCFGNFQEFKIASLKKKEAFELLRRYDKQGELSSLLIKKLQEKEMTNIDEFLVNPLLVSLLFTAFEHKQAIPFKKYLFYRQVYDANFETHDLTKGQSYRHDKYSKLEIDDFHKVLRHIGYNCFKIQKIEFNKDELLKLISDSREFSAGLYFKESDYLEDLISTVPLFTRDGNYYRWAHKSLHEYFAAQFIYLDAKDKQEAILQRFYNHNELEKFINILDLYYDMDYKTFRNVIELNLLDDFIKHCNRFQNKNHINRMELTFLTTNLMFKDSEFTMKDFFSESNGGTDKLMNKIRQEYEGHCDGIMCHTPFKKKYFGAHIYDKKMSLIRLLVSKKNILVKSFNETKVRKKNLDFEFELNNNFEPYYIDSFEENTLNDENNYEKINIFIEETRTCPYVVRHEVAFSKYKRIKDSIEKEKSNDFLLDGI